MSTFLNETLVPNSVQYPFYHVHNPTLIPGLKDHYLALAAPVIAYWAYSLFFHILDSDIFEWPAKYRIHESEEMRSKNLVSPRDVFFAVVFQHVVQTILGIFWLEESVSLDHLAEMRRLSTNLSWIAIKLLGKELGGAFLHAVGPESISWLYWWGIPIIQFFFAM